jgi:hypothetical protein
MISVLSVSSISCSLNTVLSASVFVVLLEMQLANEEILLVFTELIIIIHKALECVLKFQRGT